MTDSRNSSDIIVAEVLEIGRHTKIELPCKLPAKLFPGDLVGAAYGYRYAGRQKPRTYERKEPDETVHRFFTGVRTSPAALRLWHVAGVH